MGYVRYLARSLSHYDSKRVLGRSSGNLSPLPPFEYSSLTIQLNHCETQGVEMWTRSSGALAVH